MKRLKKIW